MAISSIYYRDADVILLVVDALSENSLLVSEKFIGEISSNCLTEPWIVLIVNKIDLLSEFSSSMDLEELKKCCPFYEKMMDFQRNHKIKNIFWTSAKESSESIDEIFNFITESIFKGNINCEKRNMKNDKRILTTSIRDRNPRKKSWFSFC